MSELCDTKQYRFLLAISLQLLRAVDVSAQERRVLCNHPAVLNRCSSRNMAERSVMESNLPIQGGCLCGAVRYRAWGKAYGVTHCHCQTCRRASGAPFVTWAGFDTDKFSFTRGQPASYASSRHVLRSFCSQCGTALTYRRLDLPGSIDVTLCSMDTPEATKPEDHTWTESRLSWVPALRSTANLSAGKESR